MFRKASKLYKRQKEKLLPDTYAPLVNAEETTMEFDMEVTPGQIDERVAFGPMAKGQKRYGSTSTRNKKDEAQGFPYIVQRGDTLQGIAVKFGVTTEQIRRTNQLWTNDSLFLRDKLIIPILDNGNGTMDGQSSCSSIVSPISSSTNESSGSNMMTTNGTTSITSFHKTSSGNPVLTPNGISEDGHNFQSPEPMSTGSKYWTHPLSDSFEYDEGLTSPDSIKLDTDSHASPTSSTTGSKTHHHHPHPFSNYNHNSYQNGDGGASNSGHSIGRTGNGLLPGESDGRETRHYAPPPPVTDHSEKSANEFLSRIDIAIATTRQKTLPLQQSSQQWVTFESDSESEQQHLQRSSGRTLLAHDSPQLRHSLRRLEKKQEELYQL